MSEENSVVFPDNWEAYVYEAEDGPVFVTFYADAPLIDRDQFPISVRVAFEILQPNEAGGPDDAEAERLWKLEDELIGLLQKRKVACVQVARLTHSGERDLVFQAADLEAFCRPVAQWIEGVADYEIAVTSQDDWEFFDECVWPSDVDWMLIQNRHVVDQLLEAGSDPEREHAIEFVFRGEPGPLAALQERLAERGYFVSAPIDEDEISEDQEGDDDLEGDDDEAEEDDGLETLEMTKPMLLDVEAICGESLDLLELCEELDVQYDGWGTAIVPKS